MERPAKSVFTKWSKQNSNERCRRRAHARFFANYHWMCKFKCQRNKYQNKLPLDVGAIPRHTADKDPIHGGKFGTNSDLTSGKVVLVQEKFQFKL